MMEQQMQVIVFKVGEELYAIDVSYIKGIEKMVPIVRIPANVPHVKGIINLRGEVIPVLGLRSKFGLQDAAITEDNRMLIVQYDGMLVALLVDSVLEIEDVTEQKYHDAPRIVQNGDTRYIRGIINDKNRLIIMIEHTELIPEEDKENMKEIINE